MRVWQGSQLPRRLRVIMSLNIEKFGEMVANRRGTLGVRAAAKEIGISPATLSRIENGHVPDLVTFAAVCRWLDEDPASFLGLKSTNVEATATVHLRKKRTTSIDTANSLGAMIIAAQNALRDRENI